jgi:DNA-binding NarL/FixJ family response regulator
MSMTNASAVRILVVDDHVILREGVVSLLEAQPDFRVIGEAGTVAEAISMAAEMAPDLVLMDYRLPDGTGHDATRAILEADPEMNIVFLTVHEGNDELFGALRIGAKGYLPKNISASEMVNRLRGLAKGEVAITDPLVHRVISEFARSPEPLSDSAFDELTPRELEILRELSRGASNRDIAEKLFISVNTVKNHVHRILEKLEVKNRRQAGKIAAEHGIV